MSSVIADLRYAAREFRRRPGFALTAVLSLALGIGATSAVFSVVYGVLINPFPYVGADRMMQLALRDNAGRFRYTGMTRRPDRPASAGANRRERRRRRTDGTSRPPMAISPKMSSRRTLSPNAPNHWGVPALMGRWLIPADAPPGQDPARVVVLGYQFWQRYYSGDPAVVGRTIQLVRKNYQIVGVMPPRFRWREADIYVPLKVRLEPNIYYGVSLKIRPGVSAAEANAELQPILQQFAKQTPGRYPDTFRVQPAQHHRAVRAADGAEAVSAARRRDVAAARRLRQRLDPAARARRAPPAGACRARRRSAPHGSASCGSC